MAGHLRLKPVGDPLPDHPGPFWRRRLDRATIGTAATVAEGVALDEAGVDLIVASGFEAGGHRVSFLEPAEQSLIGGMALIPAVCDAVRAPVVAAGGIADARGVVAALALGAEGVQIGTAFLATEESGALPEHRAALFGAAPTSLTRVVTGRLARGITNDLAGLFLARDESCRSPTRATCSHPSSPLRVSNTAPTWPSYGAVSPPGCSRATTRMSSWTN